MSDEVPSLDAALPATACPAPLAAGEAGEMWMEHAPRLLRAAIALGVSSDEAPDVVQETLLAALRAFARFDPSRASVSVWMHAILVRRVANWRRGRRRLTRFLASWKRRPPVATAAGHDALVARLTLARLTRPLSHRQRTVLALIEVCGFSAAEVSTVLGVREATVRSHLRQARTVLRGQTRDRG
ncbi:MAG: RNA polymerase sigma factor [Acidobacteriota bacterium]